MDFKIEIPTVYRKIYKEDIKVMRKEIWDFYQKHSTVVENFKEKFAEEYERSVTISELILAAKPVLEAIDTLRQFQCASIGFADGLAKDGHGASPAIIAAYNHVFEITFTYAVLFQNKHAFVFFGKNRFEILSAINLWSFLKGDEHFSFRVGDIILSKSKKCPEIPEGIEKIVLFFGGIVRELGNDYSLCSIFNKIMGNGLD